MRVEGANRHNAKGVNDVEAAGKNTQLVETDCVDTGVLGDLLLLDVQFDMLR